MNYKVKSILYFATLVIAALTYYGMDQEENIQQNQLANNTIEHVSTPEALH